MPKLNRSAYMREYRTRKRWEGHLAALAEPWEGEPEEITIPVRLNKAQLARVDALVEAVEAEFGAELHRPEAVRYALEIAHRAVSKKLRLKQSTQCPGNARRRRFSSKAEKV